MRVAKIVEPHNNLIAIITAALPKLAEKSLLVISSKIVALCVGSVLPYAGEIKAEIVKKVADHYWPEPNAYGSLVTLHQGHLGLSAGVDHSNGGGHWVLLPDNLWEIAGEVYGDLKKHYQINDFGVLIADSGSRPLLRGSFGVPLAYAGFAGLHDYRGQLDLDGQPLKTSVANLAQGFAAAAVVVMGEGVQQTPLAVIRDAPCHFGHDLPTAAERKELALTLTSDSILGTILDN